MNEARASKKLDCELLLLLFAAGALIGTLYRGIMAEYLLFVPDAAFGCMVLILVMDASMTASLFAWLTFPATTVVLGAAAAEEALKIMAVGLNGTWRRLLILLFLTPLHFLLSVWNMRTAGILRGRGLEGKVRLVSFLLMLLTYLVCIGLIYLRLQAII